MRAINCYAAAICIFLTCAYVARAADIRTYSFTGDAATYRFLCDCTPNQIRVQVTGSFKVSLDFDRGTGTLLSLDAHLANPEGSFISGGNPISWQSDYLGADSSYDAFRPPFTAVLAPSAYRPLGPDTLTAAMSASLHSLSSQPPDPVIFWQSEQVGFEPAPANAWTLTGRGGRPNNSEPGNAYFIIYLEGNEAFLDYFVGNFDGTPSIAAARATLVPEPSTLAMAGITIAFFFGGCRRRR